MDSLDLPIAVRTFIIRMHSDPTQNLSYEIAGDGCSTMLKLTWTNLACTGCQGVLCPAKIRARIRRPRPKSWAAVGCANYDYSMHGRDVGVSSGFAPGLDTTGESGEEDEEEEEQQEEKEEGGREDVGESGFYSRPFLSMSRPDVSSQLESEPVGGGGNSGSRASSHQTTPDILEGRLKVKVNLEEEDEPCPEDTQEEEEEEEERRAPVYMSSSYSESYDDCGYTDTMMSDDYQDSDLEEPPSYTPPTSAVGYPYPIPRITLKQPRTDEIEGEVCEPVAIMVDRCDQTDDMVRVVKRCHALLATMEQLYLYYDDRDHILRVSEIDKEEHVLKTKRTEATLKTLLGRDGEALRVTLEIVWIGIELDSGW